MRKNEIIKHQLLAALLALLLLVLPGCAGSDGQGGARYAAAAEDTAGVLSGEAGEASGEELPLLRLDEQGETPEGAAWEGLDTLCVTAAGSYRVTGALMGTLAVDADGPVTLVLDGVSLYGLECLDIRSNDTVTLLSAAGTQNTFSDWRSIPAGSAEAFPAAGSGESDLSIDDGGTNGSNEPEESTDDPGTGNGESVIHSKAPLIIGGEGEIIITAQINNGLRSKKDVTLAGGAVRINAANHALKVNGALTFENGSLEAQSGGSTLVAEEGRITPGTVNLLGGRVSVTSDGVGIKSEGVFSVAGGSLSVVSGKDSVRADTVSVSGGELTLTSDGDGIQAVTLLTVDKGTISITTGEGGGKAINHAGESFGAWGQSGSSTDDVSRKGLKSDGSITITGGSITLHTDDDSVHCAKVCTVEGGTLDIISSDDGIHADDMLVISGGKVNLWDCFEGLEAFAVELQGGDVYIRSVNDGVNANGTEMMFRRSEEQEQTETNSASGSASTYVRISGGTLDLVVTGNTNNMGDGVDSNGAIYIDGGTSVVSTFGSFMENGLDTGSGGPVITGGAIMAGGSSSMSESFSSSSTQCCATIKTNSAAPAGTEVTLSDEDGRVIWSAVIEDSFSCLMISHPEMQPGHIYTVTYGSTTTLDFTTSTNISTGGSGRGGGGGGFGFW